MEPSICKMCKEPIWSFLCVDCIADDARRILPEVLLKDFNSFHRKVVEIFSSDHDHTYCLKCRHPNPVAVCPYCYAKEMFSMVSGREPILTKRILRFTTLLKHPYSERNASLITGFRNKKSAYGICDECGDPSELLENTDRGWICEDCRG